MSKPTVNLISGDFIVALLTYACRCIREGRFQELQNLGLTERHIDEIRCITVYELVGLSTLVKNQNVSNISLDTVLQRLEILRTEDRKRNIMLELIRADTPRSEMYRLYGLHNDEYTALRRQCGVNSSASFHTVLSVKETDNLYHVVKSLGKPMDFSALTAEDYLVLAKATKLSVRAIVKALKETCTSQREKK